MYCSTPAEFILNFKRLFLNPTEITQKGFRVGTLDALKIGSSSLLISDLYIASSLQVIVVICRSSKSFVASQILHRLNLKKSAYFSYPWRSFSEIIRIKILGFQQIYI